MDIASIPEVPQTVAGTLWTIAFVLGGVIFSIAAAFSSLTWWVIKAARADRMECRRENKYLQDRMTEVERSSHRQSMRFADAIREITQVIRDQGKKKARESSSSASIQFEPHHVDESDEDTSTGLHRAVKMVETAGNYPPIKKGGFYTDETEKIKKVK